MIQWQEPKRAREATTRSPVFKPHITALCTAAMPVAVARQASAPSILARQSCSIVTVGLAKREYWKCSTWLANTASARSALS